MQLTADEVLYSESFFEKLKKNKVLSTVISVAAHLIVFGVIKTVHFNNTDKAVQPEESYIDLGYQQFDEVPEVVASQQPVVKSEPVIQDRTEPVTTKSEEMQDQSSDIAGLQKEVKPSVTSTNSNTTTVPYYKVKPKYPRDALEANIEGFVNLQLDILEDGSVENIKVTGGEKTSYFETAALRAVAKYKYKVFVDEFGHPMKKKDHLVRVDFKIKDELTQ